MVSYIWAVPFDRAFGNAPKRLTQGWQIQGITRFSTGFPIQLNQGSGDASLSGSSATDMPNLVGPGRNCESAQVESRLSYDRRYGMLLPAQRIRRQHRLWALLAPPTAASSTALASTTPISAYSKRTVIKENYAFDLRFEFFNIFNHAQFKNPGGNITGSSFGIVTNARDPRIGQVSAKFYW